MPAGFWINHIITCPLHLSLIDGNYYLAKGKTMLYLILKIDSQTKYFLSKPKIQKRFKSIQNQKVSKIIVK